MKNKTPLYDLKIEKSKDNKDILLINGKYIHSKFSPGNEADHFQHEGQNLIAIYGFGFGYHVNNIIKNNPKSLFIIYEPLKEVFENRYDHLDKDIFNKFNDNILILNSIDNLRIYNFLSSNLLITKSKLITYSNTSYKSLFPESEKNFFISLKNTFQMIVQNILTESNFISLWTKNFLKNMNNTNEILLLKDKKDLGENIALIACAGPNLIKDIKAIKKYRDKVTIFAVDTIIKTLFSFDIKPDFIISLDGQYFSIDDFPKDIPKESMLILDSTAYPEIAKKYNNITFTITENIFKKSIIEHFYEHIKTEHQGILTGGNISDYSLSLAISLGFKNIYFSGLDLSYPDLQTHCKGTPFFNRSIYNSNYFRTQRSIVIDSISKRDIKETYSKSKSNKLYTDFVLMNYAFYLSNFAKLSNNINIFYSETNGLEISNLQGININDLLKDSRSKRKLNNELIKQTDKISINRQDVIKYFDDLMHNIHDKSKSIKSFLNNTDFKNNDLASIEKANDLFSTTLNEFPFLNKFIIMTDLILQKKSITKDNIIWFKHTFHKLLQSTYFIIRILQKLSSQKK